MKPKYISSRVRPARCPASSTFHEYTRIRNDVQNGNTTSISIVLRHVGVARAMPYAIGYPISSAISVEKNAVLTALKYASL